jgi:hypothetical protein
VTMSDRKADEAANATLDAAMMRAVRGLAARQALVQAVRDGGLVTTETDWIEWKSQANLADPRSRMDHVIRHVLGFANRDPDRAARISEGCAYLLLGVEPGAVTGVEQIDPAILDEWTRPYLGSELRWDPDYVELDGKVVLVITVEAPRWGDPLYPLRKAFDRYADGTIFVRRPGKTDRASSREIDQLSARAARGAQDLKVRLDWRSNPNIIAPVEYREHETRAWIETERARLTPSILRRESVASGPLAQFAFGPLQQDDRSRDEYLQEVEDYLARATPAWLKRVHRAAVRHGVAAIETAIVNNSMHNFPAVEVRLTFPPEATPYLDEWDAIPDEDIPEAPRPYGKHIFPLVPPIRSARSPIRFHGAQSYVEQPSGTIHFAPIHLRPGAREPLDTVHLIVGPEMAGKELVGEWSATSTGVSGRVTGMLTVQVEDAAASWGTTDFVEEQDT